MSSYIEVQPGIPVPGRKMLERYYQCWLEGMDSRAIAEKMGIKEEHLRAYEANYMAYCRYTVQFESKENLDKYQHALQIPLTAERREQLIDLIKHGVSIGKASRILNIPIITIYDYWYVVDPTLRVEIETAIDSLDAKVMKALAKRAIGYKVKNKTVTRTSGRGADGPIDMTVESETTRDVPADINAAKFWLINRTPDKFTLDGNANRSGSKGAIMEFINAEISNVKESSEYSSSEESDI